MALSIVDNGTGNRVFQPDDLKSDLQGQVTIRGSGNSVLVADECVARNFVVNLIDNNVIEVGHSSRLGLLSLYAVRSSTIQIGSRATFNGRVRLLAHEPGLISIGEDCLFGGDVDVTLSDMHAVFDVETGNRINPAKDVVIEDRVWIAQRVLIMKGVHIGADSIVGAGSVVTGIVPPNSIVAGNPARVIRSGIRWTHKLDGARAAVVKSP